MFKETSFWLSQPPVNFTTFDNWATYLFTGTVAAGLIIWVVQRLVKHEVVRNLLARFRNLIVTMGLFGLFWAGLRFENTPIFSRRVVVLLIGLVGLIWLGFIVKYLVFQFSVEKREYEFNLQNSKYLKGRKKN